MGASTQSGGTRFGVPGRLLAALATGTVLNPLNSSMIAVALVGLQSDFGVGVGTSSWAVSGFYLAAAVGQPLVGRFADQVGARRVFLGGLALMCLVSAVAPLAPGFWWVVALRVLQAVATSAAFPSAIIVIRTASQRAAESDGANAPSGPPAGALAALTIAASTSAAFGPVLGGFLVAFAGWQAVFVVNVPLTLIGLLVGLRVLPDTGRSDGPRLRFDDIDLPGLALFVATMTALLMLLLSLSEQPRWWLVPVLLVAGGLLVWRELACRVPFLDLRGLAANHSLTAVLLQQGGVNLVFYCVFFGMPMWLESVRGFGSDLVGLLVLPTTVLGVVVTPFTARMIRRYSARALLLAGISLLLVASLAIQVQRDATPIIVLIGVALLLGVPNGVTNLALQTRLYEAATSAAGTAAGLFQTFRYLGAISATTILGLVFEQNVSSRGLHHVGLIMIAVAGALLLCTGWAYRNRRTQALPANGPDAHQP